MRAILLFALCLGSSACFLQEVSASKQLNDAVLELSKATRWGQIGTAAAMVEPTYRAKFTDNHRHWGSELQVADSEIVHVEMAPGEESALALITYQWYEMRAMTLHESVVRQRWSRTDNGFALISEVVIQGDGRLFEAGEAPAAPSADPALMSDPLIDS
jgi:hypothetical protein